MFLIPLFIGIAVATILYLSTGWWGFWAIFPWIGASISIGIYLRQILPKKKKGLGRRISILLIMPMLLIFVPVFNNENFQLEGVVLIVLVGFFSKGFIHYAVAKLFGPLVWGRGFCGWACWTAAVLEWLPIKKEGVIDERLKKIRYLTLFISILLPLVLVFLLNYDVRGDYLNRAELGWMIVGNLVYYTLAIPMAFIFKDRRAFCKIACPVSLIMKVPTRLALIRIKPTGNECIECGACNRACPMDIDVMSYISAGKSVSSTECILCTDCTISCPEGALS
jgi:polyferredoxin